MTQTTKLILLGMLTWPVLGQTIGAAAPGQVPAATTSVLWLAKTTVATVTCPETSLESGSTMTCTATLNQAAPSDKLIHPTTSDPTKITVGPDFTIPKGSLSGTFIITAL